MKRRTSSSSFWLLAAGFWLLCASGCAGPKGPPAKQGDVELSQELSSARASFTRGAWTQAVNLYGMALKRAEAMDDPAEIANAAYNYGAALTQAGRYGEAREALIESKAEAARAGSPLVDIVVLEARVARLQDRLDDAAALADAVLADKSAGPEIRLQAFLVKGQIAAARQDAGVAAEALRQARGQVKGDTLPAFAAGLEELQGELELLQRQPAAAAERFDRQAEFLRRGRLYSDMFRALARAGDAYRQAAKIDLAADRYFRAARSALALNDPAGPTLLNTAEQLGTPAMRDRIQRLRKSVPATRP